MAEPDFSSISQKTLLGSAQPEGVFVPQRSLTQRKSDLHDAFYTKVNFLGHWAQRLLSPKFWVYLLWAMGLVRPTSCTRAISLAA